MKLIKMIGLTAIAGLAAMALIGAPSASAGSTSLCSSDQSPCPTGNQVTHIHEVDPEAIMANDITAYVECIGLFLGDTLTGLANPLHITGTYSYSSCEDAAGRACSATEVRGPALLTVLRTAAELATITIENEVLWRCGFFIHCVYSSAGIQGTGEGALRAGAGNGLAKIHQAPLVAVEGFLCPRVSELEVLYEPLSATYISA